MKQSTRLKKAQEEAQKKVGNTDPAPEKKEEDTTEEIVKTEQTIPPSPDKATERSLVDFEHKYNVLKGKYEAEVPRLHQELADLKAELKSFKDAKDEQRSKEEDDGILAALKEELGEEAVGPLSKVVESRARKIAAEETQGLRESLSRLESTLASDRTDRVAQSESQFFDILDSRLPEWEKVYHDQDFVDWSMSHAENGVSFNAIIDKSFDKQRGVFNAGRVLQVFQKYLDRKGASQQAADPLEEQVIPSSRKGSGQTQTTQARIWKKSEVDDFIRKVQAGKYRGKEADKDRIHNEILVALREGRVRS